MKFLSPQDKFLQIMELEWFLGQARQYASEKGMPSAANILYAVLTERGSWNDQKPLTLVENLKKFKNSKIVKAASGAKRGAIAGIAVTTSLVVGGTPKPLPKLVRQTPNLKFRNLMTMPLAPPLNKGRQVHFASHSKKSHQRWWLFLLSGKNTSDTFLRNR